MNFGTGPSGIGPILRKIILAHVAQVDLHFGDSRIRLFGPTTSHTHRRVRSRSSAGFLTLEYYSYDVDPPLEVDDEYWEQDFVQPPDKISSLSFFAHFARLFEVIEST